MTTEDHGLLEELVEGELEQSGGVEVSEDGGDTWTVLDDVDEESAAFQQLPPHPDEIEAGDGFLYRRTAP